MIAYKLREEYEGTVDLHGDGSQHVPVFSGATVTYGDGRTFNIADALEDGGGLLVIADDSELALRLDGVDALERTDPPEDATPISGYTGLDTGVLREVAKSRGIKGTSRASRSALEAALVEQDEAVRAGTHELVVTPDNPGGELRELEQPASTEPLGVDADDNGAPADDTTTEA